MEFTSQGQGALNTVLGAIGTYGALSNGSLGNIFSGFGNNNRYDNPSDHDLVIDLKTKNAILEADLNSEKKMVEVFNAANDKINTVRDELFTYARSIEKSVDSNAAAQAVINCNLSSQQAINTSQIAQLFGLTKLVIPNGSTCPGWGNVTITPATTATTTT